MSGKINGSLDRVSAILTTCVRLHNFIIEEDGLFETQRFNSGSDEWDSMHFAPDHSAPLGMTYLPIVPNDEFEEMPGISYTRDAIVEHLQEHGICRPLHNIEHKRRELEEENEAANQNERNALPCDVEYVRP